jgi:glycosyltransferase involved in cell wall biosynthesis
MLIPDNKIRVLYVVENTSFGGGERGFGQLSTSIDKSRFLPHIVAHPGGQLEDLALNHGLVFFPLNMRRKANLNTISKISKIIDRHRINIVHSMGSRADFFARMAVRNCLSAKVICTIAMLIEGYDVGPLRKAIYKYADCYSSRFVSRYITVSKALKQWLVKERKISEKKISVIYNGVELDRYNPERFHGNGLRQSLNLKDDTVIVGSIGRMVYQKGFKYLIEAANILHRKNVNVHFVFVGKGPEEKSLKKMVESYRLSPICTFTGERFDIPQLLSDFDIFAFPSVQEGLPRVVIEAMAMRKPIVATDIEGVREELEHNLSGLIVPPGKADAFAEALIQLIRDKYKAGQLGLEARRNAATNFDLKRTVSNIERLYERVLIT